LLNPYFFKPKEYEFATKESVRVKDIQNKLQGGYHVLSGIFTELKLKNLTREVLVYFFNKLLPEKANIVGYNFVKFIFF
jgi:hypothetical protein